MKTLILNEPNKLYFTSDLHLNHANIIKYCNRPFKDKSHMNEVIINNWNSIIKDDDIIFHLGDFCLGGRGEWIHYINRLSGIKIFIKGNHDRDKDVPSNLLDGYYDGFVNINVKDLEVKGGEQRITLCHYPMLSWYQSHRKAWQLFGHMHNQTIKPLKENIEGGDEVSDFLKTEYHYISKIRYDQCDVGVDGNNFTPMSYYQIKNKISKNLENSK